MASLREPTSISPMTVPATSEARSSSISSPSSEPSPSEERVWLRLVASGIALLTSSTSPTVHSRRPATSSSVGSRLSSVESSLYARAIFRILSPMCTGTRMVRPLSATARCTACLIHHVAYVENLQPRSGSNFSTARIRPTLPSWIRSSKGSPIPRYLLATLTTSLRFFSTSFLRARLSPAWARLLRSISSWCVRRFPLSIRAKYPGMRSGVSMGRSFRLPFAIPMVSIKLLLALLKTVYVLEIPHYTPTSRHHGPREKHRAGAALRYSKLYGCGNAGCFWGLAKLVVYTFVSICQGLVAVCAWRGLFTATGHAFGDIVSGDRRNRRESGNESAGHKATEPRLRQPIDASATRKL